MLSSLQRLAPSSLCRLAPGPPLSVAAPALAGALSALRRAFLPPPPLAPQLLTATHDAGALPARECERPQAPPWLIDVMLMAAPKNRKSYTKKRMRQAAQMRHSGPKHKAHIYMCPVCERLRLPHRVCDREDCQTYFSHKWF